MMRRSSTPTMSVLVGGALDPDRRLAALQRIRLGTAAEYDPRVVDSLTRIVEATDLPY